MYRPFIEQMIAWLRRCGVTVHEHANLLPSTVSGMYRSETKEIFLNEPCAELAVMTIAHEAGHWLGYLIEEKPTSFEREQQAFECGWHILQWFDVPIYKGLWDFFHDPGNAAVDYFNPPPTQHLYK